MHTYVNMYTEVERNFIKSGAPQQTYVRIYPIALNNHVISKAHTFTLEILVPRILRWITTIRHVTSICHCGRQDPRNQDLKLEIIGGETVKSKNPNKEKKHHKLAWDEDDR